MDAVNIPSYNTADEKTKWPPCERQFPPSVLQHLPLSAKPSVESIRSSASFEGTLNIDPSSLLFAANEMLKNLFDMATDSFGLKSGSSVVPPVELEGTQVGRNGLGIPYIYHPGAVTAAFDLLPAISEMNGTVLSEVNVFTLLFMVFLFDFQTSIKLLKDLPSNWAKKLHV